MKKYAGLLVIAVMAAALLTGCKNNDGTIVKSKRADNQMTAYCVTLEFVFKEIAESEEGGGALEEIVRMTLTQRVNLGGEFQIDDEKTVDYEEDVEGITIPLSGTRMFSVIGSTKMLGGTSKFTLNAELRYMDQPAKIHFNGKPSLSLSMHSDEEVTITKSGPIIVTLKVSMPEEVIYTK